MENSNFGQATKKAVYIVYEDKLESYAMVLSTLISQSVDYKATRWTAKEYENNSSKMTSENKILFLGKNKKYDSIIDTFLEKFNKFDIVYCQRGTTAFLYVNEKNKLNIFSKDEEFLEYYEELNKKINSPKDNVSAVDKKWILLATALASFSAWWFIAPLSVGVAVTAWVGSVFGVKLLPDPMLDAKYKAGVIEFYINGLDGFMNGEKNEQSI